MAIGTKLRGELLRRVTPPYNFNHDRFRSGKHRVGNVPLESGFLGQGKGVLVPPAPRLVGSVKEKTEIDPRDVKIMRKLTEPLGTCGQCARVL
jgi:hypothetical protein